MVQSSGQSYLETIMLFTSVSQVIKTYNGKGEINKTCNNFHLQKYLAEFYPLADGRVVEMMMVSNI